MDEAQSDAKLAALLGMDAAPQSETEQPSEPTAAQAESQPEGEVVTGTPEPEEDPQLERARTALKRSGFLDSELDSLDRDTLLARGLKRSEALAAEQDTFRRLRDLEAKLEDSTATPQARADTRTTLEEVRAKLEPLQQALADEGEATGPLADVIAGLVERLDRSEALQAQNSQQTEMQHISASRGRLKERFLELSDDRIFDAQVRPRMEVLAKDGSFNDPSKSLDQRFDALLEASLRSLNYSPRAADPTPPVASRKAEHGSPLSPDQNQRPKPLDPDSRARMVFDMIDSGKSEDEIRSAVG